MPTSAATPTESTSRRSRYIARCIAVWSLFAILCGAFSVIVVIDARLENLRRTELNADRNDSDRQLRSLHSFYYSGRVNALCEKASRVEYYPSGSLRRAILPSLSFGSDRKWEVELTFSDNPPGLGLGVTDQTIRSPWSKVPVWIYILNLSTFPLAALAFIVWLIAVIRYMRRPVPSATIAQVGLAAGAAIMLISVLPWPEQEGTIRVIVAVVGLFLTLYMAVGIALRCNESPTPIASHNCVNCNYDLTGNTSGRCPECGRPTLNPESANVIPTPGT